MVYLAFAIFSATAGQLFLSRHDLRGLLPYGLAVLALLLGLRQQNRNWGKPPDVNPRAAEHIPPERNRHQPLFSLLLWPLALSSGIIAVLAAANNTYRWYGVLAWLLSIVLFMAIFWERKRGQPISQQLKFDRRGLRLSWTQLALIGIIGIGLFFRFWRLEQMPSEMTSDHIEKLLDVHDLVTGERPIFFVRNTGREPWQFYWTLMLIRLFDLETRFFALKLGTAAIGLLMLPGVYLLGSRLFGRWVGLWATLFAAVASWPVILSRVGLRFPFAPAATAWSLFYLVRGLRDGRRNDFLLLGLWLGIGLHGYTAFRMMPLAVLLCWGLALAVGSRSLTVQFGSLFRNALLTVLIAAVVLIPLGRFSIEHPDDFWRRSFSRMADPNQAAADAPIPTLIGNLRDVAVMFHWKGDDVWVNTIADAPILDPLLGGLLVLGLIVVLWRIWRWRDPIAPLLLLAGFILLLPSALSLAYPVENPSVVRAGGAIPVVMIIAALPLGLGPERVGPILRMKMPQTRMRLPPFSRKLLRKPRQPLIAIGALILAVGVIAINGQRYFGDYWSQYRRNALNTTEIASAIQGFIESGGDPRNAWIVAWPYWIDTRGVGIEIGHPPWNNVILDTEILEEQAQQARQVSDRDSGGFEPRPRFYVLHPADQETLALLRSLFPEGWSSTYDADHDARDFILYYVPQTSTQGLSSDGKGNPTHAQ